MNPTADRMADVRDMYMAHTMIRREFALLPQLVRDVEPYDTERRKSSGPTPSSSAPSSTSTTRART